jgi:hypothetical protein
MCAHRTYLEDVGTEFHVQGLELDWACVTWDANFRHTVASVGAEMTDRPPKKRPNRRHTSLKTMAASPELFSRFLFKRRSSP